MTKLDYKKLQMNIRLVEFSKSHYGFSLQSWCYIKMKTGKFPNELSVEEMKKLLINVSDYGRRKLWNKD